MSAENSHTFGYDRQKALNHRKITRAEEESVGEKERRQRLKTWFDYHERTAVPKCEECGKPIPRWIKLVWHSAQAHILPKSIFEDVMDAIENHMTLGPGCGCHSRFDKSWESASKMKIFPEAWRRVQLILPLIKTKEQLDKIPEIFLKPLPPKQVLS
jgi:hypothetical protein